MSTNNLFISLHARLLKKE